MRIKTIKVPATTNNITKGIINFLNANGHFAFRVNTVGVWDNERNLYRRGSFRGCADILCCLYYRKTMVSGRLQTNFNCGLFLAIEVKNLKTKDRINEAQQQFCNGVTAARGLYVIATSYDGFVEWYHSQNFEHNPAASHEPATKALPG